MDVQLHTLSNGATVVIDPMPDASTVAMGLHFRVGASAETEQENGIAHFLEHMAFKGTETLDCHALNMMRGELGGNGNAFTAQDWTAYYLTGLPQDAPRILDLFSDVVLHSTLPEEEVRHERGTILQEIAMNNDTPASLNLAATLNLAFPGHPLGRRVLGTEENIAAMDRQKLKAFRDRFYTGNNLVISIAGKVDPTAILGDLERTFGGLPANGQKVAIVPATYRGGQQHFARNTEQLNLMVSFNAASAKDPKSSAERVLAKILGDGVSSRLFDSVRARRGLAYGVNAVDYAWNAGGLLSISVGTEPDKAGEVADILSAELRRLATEPVSQGELQAAKIRTEYALAQGRESAFSRMTTNAHYATSCGRTYTLDEALAGTRAVTAADVQEAARRVFSGKPTVTSVGPGERVPALESFAASFSL